MGFVLDARLWGGLPLRGGGRSLTLTVTHLDSHAGGKLEIAVDTAAGCTSHVSQGSGTGRWIRKTIRLTNGHFAQRCPSKAGSADIVLRSSGTSDVIVHGLEIYDPSMLS
eukprot:COSAG01_NODE_6104_length_3849_cov_4.556267_2_plen_110_part_00